jgi:aspartyl-tRNA(Asn)/glutamyl-tRNA(Gln) amidotransferase subunit B
MPGVLPVINRRAVEYTVMMALALNCQIPSHSKFDRKNYPYPDLVKGYQISQYDLPLSQDGWVEIEVDGELKRVGVTRVHLEEDTAKLTHVSDSRGSFSLVDVNRSGVPLMEIVSEPDMRSAEEARQYLLKLHRLMRYLGVSTGNMEEGAMRCEANISLRPIGSQEYGTKVEVKNLNSFRAVKESLEYEIERQSEVLEAGGQVEQVTMGWDEAGGRTVVQRSKEFAHDYRYFPEPDLPPVSMSEAWVDEIRARLPELPDQKRVRFVEDYGLSEYDVRLLVADRTVADYYERAVESKPQNAKLVANWLTGEVFHHLRSKSVEIGEIRVSPEQLGDLVDMVQLGKLNTTIAKTVLERMLETGKPAGKIVDEEGLAPIGEGEIHNLVEKVLDENPKPVEEYLEGKEQALRFLVGQVMKASRGKANPQLAQEMLRSALESRRG